MLTELQVKNAKPKEKYYMLRDDRGLYLRVDPSGRKYWILRYWENKKERQMSLGKWSELSLKDARLKRDEIHSRRAKGENIKSISAPSFFEDVADEWLKVHMSNKAKGYIKAVKLRLKKYILPYLKSRPLKEITSGEILTLCRKIENNGFIESASRVKNIIGQIFRFAIAAGWVDTDPTAALKRALMPARTKHYPTITKPDEIALLFKNMRAYPYPVMRSALLLSIYTALRPGEIRTAEWSEFDFDKKIWKIPAGKMKMKREHIVLLATQVVKLLTELKQLTGDKKYLFPSDRNDGRCMSDGGVRVALRALGFSKELITPHGFRAMFSTIANEQGWNRDVIERQLSHVEQNKVRAAYNHAEYLPERIKIMQWWADWLENLLGGVVKRYEAT